MRLSPPRVGSAAWGEADGNPSPWSPLPPPEQEGGTSQDPWSLFKPSPELSPHLKESEKDLRKAGESRQGNSLAADKSSPVGCPPPHVSGCLLHFQKLCSPGQRLSVPRLSTHQHQALRQALSYMRDRLSHLPTSLWVTRFSGYKQEKLTLKNESKKESIGRRLVSSWK